MTCCPLRESMPLLTVLCRKCSQPGAHSREVIRLLATDLSSPLTAVCEFSLAATRWSQRLIRFCGNIKGQCPFASCQKGNGHRETAQRDANQTAGTVLGRP